MATGEASRPAAAPMCTTGTAGIRYVDMESTDLFIELAFRQDRSARYPFAVSLARQFPTYGHEDDGGSVHSVQLNGELRTHEGFTRFISLLKIVSEWKDTVLTVSGEPMPAAAIERLIHVGECYQRQRRAGNRDHYCNGFDPRHAPTSFGCRLLTEVNRYLPRNGQRPSDRAWYRFGELQGTVFRTDKEGILDRLFEEAVRKLAPACPVFSAEVVAKEVETLPDEIDIEADARWAVENRSDGTVGIRPKTTGAPQVEKRTLAHGDGPVAVPALPDEEEGRVVPDVRFSDVAGQDKAVAAVRDWVELPLRHPELFRHVGVPTKVGIILHGPPGTGKTLLAQAVAGECEAHLEMINGPEILSKWVGQSEETLRTIFERARRHAPAVVLLDEVDAIAPKRDHVLHGHEVTLVSQLLALLDGLFDRGQVVVIATTNRIDAVDPALRRPGRFDYAIQMPMPDAAGRQAVFERHLSHMSASDAIDTAWLAELTPHMSGADIAKVCRQAGLACIKEAIQRGQGPGDGVKIELRHLLGALQELGSPHVTPIMDVGS